jgi:hypothetical protein
MSAYDCSNRWSHKMRVQLVQPCPLPREKPSHWIEIELLDARGKPVAGEAYLIKLTDGSIREGNLDNHGRARWDGIEAGICAVWWPNRGSIVADSGEARPAVPSGHLEDYAAKPPGEPPAWIEINLVGQDGKPIDGERYTIKFPDGTEFEGILDEHGRAFFDDLDPGNCEFSFPDLSPGVWEKV